MMLPNELKELHLGIRRPSLDEAEAISDLYNAADQHDYGTSEYTAEEIRDELAPIDLGSDAWVVDGPDGGPPVGFASLSPRGARVAWEASLLVRPDWRRRGVGRALAELAETRAGEHVEEAPPDVEVILRGWVKGGSRARGWAERLGFVARREFLRMRIDMTQPPARAEWPAGIGLRTFVPQQDERATFEALEEAFADHWGHLPAVFDEWVTRTTATSFDPSLWLLATEGDEIVGSSLGSVGPEGGWITGVGTRRPWRRRGISTALMLELLGEFWRRDVRSVALGVDGQSLTGAARMYERLGMRVVERHEQMAKVLRKGTDLTTTELR
jgi:mycothiol synthase